MLLNLGISNDIKNRYHQFNIFKFKENNIIQYIVDKRLNNNEI